MEFPVSADQVITCLEAMDKKPMDLSSKMFCSEALVPVINEAFAKGISGKPLQPVDFLSSFRVINGEEPSAGLVSLFEGLNQLEKDVYDYARRVGVGTCGVQRGGVSA